MLQWRQSTVLWTRRRNLFDLLYNHPVYLPFCSQDHIPPLACKFSVDGLHGNLLAVADEEGIVGLYDTRRKLSDFKQSKLSGTINFAHVEY